MRIRAVHIVLLMAMACLLGACSADKMEIHHVFPQEFRKEFSKRGINIDDYGIRLSQEDHRGKGGLHSEGWNPTWKEFFNANPEATKKQIMEHMEHRLAKAGFLGLVQFVKYAPSAAPIQKTGEIIIKHRHWALKFAGGLGEMVINIFGKTTWGSMCIGFFASLGSAVLGYFGIRAEYPVAVGVGVCCCIVGLLGLLGIVYLMVLIYPWLIALLGALLSVGVRAAIGVYL